MENKDFEEEVVACTNEIPYIDDSGNVSYRKGSNKVCLAKKEINEDYEEVLKKLSKDYYYMEPIYGNDLAEHYIVCDVNSSQNLEYEEEFEDSKLSYKYGIIRIKRDKSGNIIPMAEEIVVPILYDQISENNLDTVTAYANDHLTYIDINPISGNYGKQIVPAVLEHAVPFSVDYENFAECSVDGVVGYLPRNCKPKTKLNSFELLTEEQVKALLTISELNNDALYSNSIYKYVQLTGENKTLNFNKK